METLLFKHSVPFIVPEMAEEQKISQEECRKILADQHRMSEAVILDLQYPKRADERDLKQMAKARKRQHVFNNKASATD